ncbi:unnamed protein product [Chilo suppressalis]|uniref:MADF domain-containing protein n=1 Tax=Chilo suppressalis TaxID=168631 RepID=A0ABN8L8M8_CHISP|nr:hypothetical protein evm_013180 [Chilo suppressalis]CAH2987302.1 unnamed protein product [Chilo suppressalis]
MESGKRKSSEKIVDKEDLIMMVKERSCLWDRSSMAYRDRAVRDRAWNEIYRMVEPDYDKFSEEMKNLIGLQITKKWYNIRDSYVKSKKLQRLRQKPYLHSKLLGFLDNSFKNLDDSVVYEKDENEEQWLEDVLIVEDEMDLEHETKRSKLNDADESKESTVASAEHNIVNVLANLINREDDEDRAFFTSIMPAVKKLSEDSKFEFRIRMINTLKKLLRQERCSETMKFKVLDEDDVD